MQIDELKDSPEAIGAIGWISAELASRADAWNGNAPSWFPEPPEWLELWRKGLDAVRENDKHVES